MSIAFCATMIYIIFDLYPYTTMRIQIYKHTSRITNGLSDFCFLLQRIKNKFYFFTIKVYKSFAIGRKILESLAFRFYAL